MLKKLLMTNVALVDYAEIEFSDGLNVLSGETGAGKSVIIDSINFVLGAKADKSMIRYGTSESVVTAIFTDVQSVNSILEEFDISVDDDLIIKRKFTIEGKGYITVNGEHVTVNMLKKITAKLVDVHGQSEHYTLLKESNQLDVIDKFGAEKISSLKTQLYPLIKQIKGIESDLEKLGGDESGRAIRLDVLKYQIEEIDNACLTENEENELIERKLVIKNSEKIAQNLSFVKNLLSEEGCGLDCINSAVRNLQNIASYSDKYEALLNRLDVIATDLSDIDDNVNDYLEEIDFNEYELTQIEERLDLISKLKRKYGNTYQDIQNFYKDALDEYEKLLNFDKNAQVLLETKEKLYLEIKNLYEELTQKRIDCAKEFSNRVIVELQQLGMKNCSFNVEFFKNDNKYYFSENGVDSVKFMFSANAGEPLKEMSKVISGGEMSRFMLGMKSVICNLQDISTFIFDEIDAGISGKVAQIVAEKFANISKFKQIIAISHLAQICAMADTSLLISKKDDGVKTLTSVKNLNKDEKVYEILRLIGGNPASEIAQKHAKDIITYAEQYKNNIIKN